MKRFFFVVMFILLLPALGAPCHAEPAPVGVDIVVDIRSGGTAVIAPRADNPMPEEPTLTLRAGQYGVFHIVYSTVGDFWYTVQVQENSGSVRDDTVYTLEVFVTEEEGELDAVIVVYRDNAKSAPIMVKPSYLHVEEKWVPISFNKVSPSDDHVPPASGTSGQGESQKPDDPDDPNNPQNPDDPDNPQNPDDPNNPQNPSDPNDPNSPQDANGSAGTANPPDGGGDGSGPSGSDTAEDGTLTGQPKTGDDSALLRHLVTAILASAGLFLLSVLYLIDTLRASRRSDRR